MKKEVLLLKRLVLPINYCYDLQNFKVGISYKIKIKMVFTYFYNLNNIESAI
jgi:hypothetical protein